MNRNRALLIVVIVVVVVIVALLLLYFFTRGGATPTSAPPGGGTLPVSTTTPGGAGGMTPGGGTQPGGQAGYQNQPQAFSRLRELSSLPVAGATLFVKGTDIYARYVERGKGFVDEAQLSQNAPPYRIAATDIQRIEEAYWAQNGQGFLLRYLEDGSDAVKTFYARLSPSATTSQDTLSDGTFLSGDITALAVSPNQDKIFYLVRSNNQTYGVESNPDGSRKAQLFSSTANEWLVNWEQASTIALTTKPSSSVPGYLYFLNASSGAFTKILGGLRGLTALPSPDGSLILYTQSPQNLSLALLDLKTQKTSDVGVKTLPEKCVWSNTDNNIVYCAVPESIPAAQYPDAWYQGSVSFADSIWKINARTGETDMILSPEAVAGQSMDITNLTLDSHDHYLLFINKKNLSLWVLDLTQPAS